MAESDSFSSLMALVNSHLSKNSIPISKTNDIDVKISRAIQTESFSDVLRPKERLQLPDFGITSTAINDVLVEQVSNMLRNKERRREEERLYEKLKKLEIKEKDNDDYIIDLNSAIIKPSDDVPPIQALSRCGSLDPVKIEVKITEKQIMKISKETPPDILPCLINMPNITLSKKIRKGKCSAFGKVLAARYIPVAAPYLKEKVESKMVQFDFKTPSPCDIYREKRSKPSIGNPNYIEPMEIILQEQTEQ